jgi:serine/threonine-protein kinase
MAAGQSVAEEMLLRPKLPLRLGRFTLCEELGSGGMATVYLSRMELAAGLERLVALKTIHPHLAKEKPFVDMFLDEARIASHVSHPNVCAVYDFGEASGLYYLAMEHLIGEPLFDVINRIVDRFDEMKEVLPYLTARVIADACEGIHAAHTARGPDGQKLHIVHRDVSPQNLFVTYDGTVKVVDFGCAKAAQRVAHTSTGIMKGKVGYAAPEQLRGGADVDGRADVWALGVCLWETLTLSPLFTKDTAVATAMAVLEDPIPPPSADRPWVPEGIVAITERALARDREQRYRSARDMGRDLRKFIAESGFTLEAAEIAEWMDFLFQDRHEQREQQATRVRELDVSDAEPARVETLYAHEADVELIDSRSMDAIPLEDDRESVPTSSSARRRPTLPTEKRSGMRWIVALIAVALLAGGIYYAQLYYEPAPWALEMVGLRERARPTRRGSAKHVAPKAIAEAPTPPTTTPTPPTKQPSTPTRHHGSGGGGDVITVVSGGGGSEQPTPAPEPTPTPTPNVAPTPVAPEIDNTQVSGGWVHIEASAGYADIYLGGHRLGRTPFRRELPAGHQRLRVLPYGQEPGRTLAVDIEPGVEQSFTIDVDQPPSP